MSNGYIAQLSEARLEFVDNLIHEDAMEYASDGANNRITQRYFLDVLGIELPDNFSTIVLSLTRSKSKILEKHPELDLRDKDLRGRRNKLVGQGE